MPSGWPSWTAYTLVLVPVSIVRNLALYQSASHWFGGPLKLQSGLAAGSRSALHMRMLKYHSLSSI